MSESLFIITQVRLFWKFLSFFQSYFLRSLHAVVAVLVALQIISGIGGAKNMQSGMLAFFLNTYHKGTGILLFFISLFFIVYSLKLYGVRHFFPYLWGDISRLKNDISASIRFKLVAPRPGGLAAAVQGLGLGALLLAVGSGIAWCAAFFLQSGIAPHLLKFHKIVVILMGLYFIGHGGMAILHFLSWRKNISRTSSNSTTHNTDKE